MDENAEHLEDQPADDGGYYWLALIVLILGTFMAILDNSLMNVALPKLMNVFGVSQKSIEWVVTGYMLASAVVVPMGGFLADRFGYKRTFLTTVTAFVIGSALCGIAWSNSALIFFRIIQGLGGGFIMPVGMAMLYQIMPREKIQVGLGIWGISAMAAPAMGPTLSGYLVDNFSWRFLFYINLPVGILAVTLGLIILRETPKHHGLKFDVKGSVLAMSMFGTLLLALTDGQSDGWTSFYIVGLFFIAFFSFLLLLWVELTVDNPILDFRLFKNITFAFSTIIASFVTIALMGGVYLIPIFLQNVQDYNPMQTGLIMMPQSIAMAIMMPVAGRLADKYGVILIGVVGLLITGIMTVELQHMTLVTPRHWISMVLVFRGIGIGLCMMPLSAAGMNTLPNSKIGRASSMSNVIRMTMASFGIAVLTSIMTSHTTTYAVRMGEHINTGTAAFFNFSHHVVYRYMDLGAAPNSASGGVMGVLFGMIQKHALDRGITDTFFISAIPAFVSIIFVFFMKSKKAGKKASPANHDGAEAQHVMMEM